jgi:hypothetical protein
LATIIDGGLPATAVQAEVGEALARGFGERLADAAAGDISELLK